ncbi:MAG TPA: hypothetical protein VGI05_26530 [Streptosporangiaceae bacterium]
MSEAESWLAGQPKTEHGKVSVFLLIAEGQQRGYCICPKPLRQLIVFDGWSCQWCHQPETRESWAFWYDQPPPPGERVIICPRCGAVSANANDIKEGYCGACHDWTTPRYGLWPGPAE